MSVVKIDPTDEFPVPYSLEDEEPRNFMDGVAIAGKTAELLEELGHGPLEIDPTAFDREKALIDAVVKKQESEPLKQYPTAMAASAFIKTYGHNLAHDVMEVRAALTNKLLEIANCGDVKHELRAIELLGKHSDISLFTQRSEININYNSPEALENAIKERVKRLLSAEVVDIPVLGADLDEELGVYVPEPQPEEPDEDDE